MELFTLLQHLHMLQERFDLCLKVQEFNLLRLAVGKSIH